MDPSGFTRGQKEAAASLVKQKTESEKWRKSAESDARKVTEGFAKFKKEVIAVAVAFFGLSRIKSFTANLVTTGTELVKLSSNIGMSVKSLSLLENMFQRMTGGAAGEMGSFLEQIGQMGEQFRQGVQVPGLEGDSPLVRAGLDIGKFVNQATSAQEQMFMLSDALSKLQPKAALLWGQQLGFSENIIFLLRQGPEAIKTWVKEQERIRFETEAEAKALMRLNQDWTKFVQVVEQAGKGILFAVEPTLIRLGLEFQDWLLKSGGIEKIVDGVKQFAAWLERLDWKQVGEGLQTIVKAAQAIVDVLGGVEKTLKTLGGAWLGAKAGRLAGPWGALIGALIGGAAGPHVGEAGDMLKDLRARGWQSDFFKIPPAFKGSDADWQLGWAAPEAAKANPPIMPTAATIKPPPGTAAGQGITSVTINNLIVNTNATDAAGMARGAKTALTRELSTVTQAGGGGQ